MTEQLAMTGTEAYQVATGRALTPRQQQVFDHVRTHDGVTADQVGALLHSQRGKRQHPIDDRCTWCARDGHAALVSKALNPLITYRNTGSGRVYVVRNPEDRIRDEPADAAICPECAGELTVNGLVCTTCHGNPFYGL